MSELSQQSQGSRAADENGISVRFLHSASCFLEFLPSGPAPSSAEPCDLALLLYAVHTGRLSNFPEHCRFLLNLLNRL